MFGKEAWNSGSTAETDPRILKYATKQTGQKRTGNYHSPTAWQGSGNPWFGKDRSNSNSPRYKGEIRQRELRDYYNKVAYLTEQTYNQHVSEINPHNYVRTLAGVDGGYHLDHIYPVAEGYDNKIPPEVLANVDNLILIPWRENVIKSNKVGAIPESIKTYLKENLK